MTIARWGSKPCVKWMMNNTKSRRNNMSNRSSTTIPNIILDRVSQPQWTNWMIRNAEKRLKSPPTKEDKILSKTNSTRNRWNSRAANCIKSSLIRSRTKTRYMRTDTKVALAYGTSWLTQSSISKTCSQSFCSSWSCTRKNITRFSCHIQ